MTWIYKNVQIHSIENLPNNDKIIGYVYRIVNTLDNKIYIGKKSLFHSKKTKISKKEKESTGTRKTFKRTTKESDWKTYYGSCIELKSDVKLHGAHNFTREIIELCYTKKYLSYCEVKHQIQHNVLETNSYNANILSRYFTKDIIDNQEKQK